MNLWDEDVKLDINDAKLLIENQFKQIIVKDISLIGSGFDNNIYRVNNDYVFRFPRRKVANELIIRESKLLPIIKDYVRECIPIPMFYGEPCDNYPYYFLGYNYLNGYSIEDIIINSNIKTVEFLANFLIRLHSIPVEKVIKYAGYDELDRVNIEKRITILNKNIESIKNLNIYDTTKVELYANNLRNIPTDEEKVLVHGDLHVRNVLYDKNGIVNSVIDFGDIHVGHRACDLAIVYSLITRDLREQFYNIYGEVTQDTKDIARFRAIYTNLYLLLHASDTNNIELFNKIASVLNNALD